MDWELEEELECEEDKSISSGLCSYVIGSGESVGVAAVLRREIAMAAVVVSSSERSASRANSERTERE